MLLGIGNKMQGHFWEFTHDRIEVMLIESLEAQNFKILCYIALERCQEEVDKMKIELDEAKENRKNFNQTHKKSLTDEQKARRECLKGVESKLLADKKNIEKKLVDLKKIQ